MLRSYIALAPLLCLSVASACSIDVNISGTEGPDTGVLSATDTDADPTSGTTAEPTTGEPFEAFPARGGIVIDRVEANSGVAVAIGKDGAEVGGADRVAYLPARRDTLIRAYVKLPEDWVPRELEAQLKLSGGGVDKVYTAKMLVENDSRDSDLTSTFSFGVKAEHVQPGLKYSITLWETAPGAEDMPEGDVPPQSPHSGNAFVGIEDAIANMRVVLVPVAYDFGGCQATVDGAAIEGKFKQALFQQNALESLDFTVHEPYPVTFDMTQYQGLSRLVSEMSQLRTAEGADPNVYYYGIFDNCGECIGGGDGIATGCTVGLAADITGPDKSDASRRAAAGQMTGKPEDTFVHEIGHTQGRRHIECPGGNSQGNDGTYPHANGIIGVWGFGIQDIRLRHPSTHSDYMSYCGSTWVSDWQWNNTYQRIRTLSGWDLEGAPAPGHDHPGEGGLLLGAIDDGQQIWWTAPGSLGDDVPRSATHTVDFEFADGTMPVAAQVSVRPHGTTLNIVAPLPADFDQRQLQGLTLRAPEGDSAVEPTAVRWLHRPDRLKAAE
ncbi:hypothetical protein [Nannocystis punicea]|uniref:Metallo-peptidase family M12B Reprolysin-like n=1 Tax=Nannocystis punicea TaxID=2995304 RepID=A0ABY7HEW6_9BACT|nr:hypothetical protein [Nannocystis poenicansa]WAS97564.1 hypothetical protein O0S08_15575 [Nannocystis poenicansa]